MWKTLSFFLTVFLLCSCATHTNGKKYIAIQEPDVVYNYGEVKYNVKPGDTLEVIKIPRCKLGIGRCTQDELLEVFLQETCTYGQGDCWGVKNMATGEFGYVKPDEMRSKHRVYVEPGN